MSRFIQVRNIKFEDNDGYTIPCMVLDMPYCNPKYNNSNDVCDTYPYSNDILININIDNIIYNYNNNPNTKAIIFQGLEPFYRDMDVFDISKKNPNGFIDNFSDILYAIKLLRVDYKCNDSIIIHTGYTRDTCSSKGFLKQLQEYNNITITYGKYVSSKPGKSNITWVE